MKERIRSKHEGLYREGIIDNGLRSIKHVIIGLGVVGGSNSYLAKSQQSYSCCL